MAGIYITYAEEYAASEINNGSSISAGCRPCGFQQYSEHVDRPCSYCSLFADVFIHNIA